MLDFVWMCGCLLESFIVFIRFWKGCVNQNKKIKTLYRQLKIQKTGLEEAELGDINVKIICLELVADNRFQLI